MDRKREPVSRGTPNANTAPKQRRARHTSPSPIEITASDLKRFMNSQEGKDALALLTQKNSWIPFGSKMISGGEATYCLTGQGLRCYDAGSGLPSRPTGRTAPPLGDPASLEAVAAIYIDPATSSVPGSNLSIGVFIRQALERAQRGHLE